MPDIKLPDGSIRTFENPVTIAEVAASIGAGLARAALAGKVDGKLVDTSYLIEKDADLAPLKSDQRFIALITKYLSLLHKYPIPALLPRLVGAAYRKYASLLNFVAPWSRLFLQEAMQKLILQEALKTIKYESTLVLSRNL